MIGQKLTAFFGAESKSDDVSSLTVVNSVNRFYWVRLPVKSFTIIVAI